MTQAYSQLSSARLNPAERMLRVNAGQLAQRMGDVYSQLAAGPETEVFTPKDVWRRAAHVMQSAKPRVALIADGDTTLAMQPWNTWQVERSTIDLLTSLMPKDATDIRDLRKLKVSWDPFGQFVHHQLETFVLPPPPEPDFKAAEVHRRARRVLDEAKERPVIVEHKHTLLVIDDAARRSFERGVLAALDDVRQFQVARQLRSDEQPIVWAFATPYPWVAALPPDEADAFASELMLYLLETVRRGSLDFFLGNLRGWQLGAEDNSRSAVRLRFGPKAKS